MSPLAPVATPELETREASPANFIFKIDSFSLLDKHEINKLETREFEAAGDYKWRLVIYPNGHETGKDEEGYVSVYLVITNTSSLPSNWEVNATFSICLFNHASGNYCYSLGRARRFHALKQEWGFMKFMSKKDFTDPSNGYVVDDKCVFGAEVLVNENKAVVECLSLKSVDKEPYKQEFMISNFSRLRAKWVSTKFTFGGHQWLIEVYPNGNGKETGRSLSIYLRKVFSNNATSSERVRPCFTIRLKEQSRPCTFTICLKDQSMALQHHQRACANWFSASGSQDWGWHSFIKLSTLKDPKKGFIVKDCCVFEIEMSLQAISS